jgi:hypothetical protein
MVQYKLDIFQDTIECKNWLTNFYKIISFGRCLQLYMIERIKFNLFRWAFK